MARLQMETTLAVLGDDRRYAANEMTSLVAQIFELSNWLADLVRVGQGMELSKLIDYATNQSMMTEEIRLSYNEAIIGHVSPLDDLQHYVNNHCKNSFRIESIRQPTRIPLEETGEAIGQIKKQCSSADQYAYLRVRASPRFDKPEIRLTIPSENAIAEQLHHHSIAEAILDGIKIASCTTISEALVTGYDVKVLEGKYHDVDSHAGAFRNAARIAMSEILREQIAA